MDELNKLFRKKKYAKHYIRGFVDAEGCFSVSLKKQKTARFGWVLDPVFQVSQHRENSLVLELLRKELTCGRIAPKSGQEETMTYTVDNRRQLKEKILPFFEKYKLLVKANDFRIFSEIVTGLEEKKHSKPETFAELIKKAFKMNLGGKQRRHELKTVLMDLKCK